MLFFLIFMLMRLIAWCGLYDVFFFCSGESSQLTCWGNNVTAQVNFMPCHINILKAVNYYAAYTPVRVICWIVFKKNEITSGAVYTPSGLSPGKYGNTSTWSLHHSYKRLLCEYKIWLHFLWIERLYTARKYFNMHVAYVIYAKTYLHQFFFQFFLRYTPNTKQSFNIIHVYPPQGCLFLFFCFQFLPCLDDVSTTFIT